MAKLSIREKEYASNRIYNLCRDATSKEFKHPDIKKYNDAYGELSELKLKHPVEETFKLKPFSQIKEVLNKNFYQDETDGAIRESSAWIKRKDLWDRSTKQHPDVLKQEKVVEKLKEKRDAAYKLRDDRDEKIEQARQEALDTLWLGEGLKAIDDLKTALAAIPVDQ